ncbi:MAG: hypothetical protein ABJ033_05920, partial [Nonlabens ulvanivorans]
MRILILLGFVLSFFVCAAQDENNFWYFGQNAGLDFSTSPPTALNNGSLDTSEGCSTISDNLGNLLFYSDGITVWNRNHIPMPNGFNLSGNSSDAQTPIIAKVLGTNSSFYLITKYSFGGFFYSIINMELDNGLGDIVANRKEIMFTNFGEERITLVTNSNEDGYWIVIYHDGEYRSFQASGGSINNNPVFSILPSTSVGLIAEIGQLKASPDGTKLINTEYFSTPQEVFLTDFNNSTGVVSNPIQLFVGSAYPHVYGAEFSPDSNFIYLAANSIYSSNSCTPGLTNQREIFQFNIHGMQGWNSNPIALGSGNMANGGRGSLQLGPDGKIYCARNCKQWLGVINNPTISGTGAGYVDDGIALASGTFGKIGLQSTVAQNYSDSFNTVQGNILWDSNGNGCSPTEIPFTNTFITMTSAGFDSYSITNNNGDYTSLMPNGQFTLTPNPETPSYWNFSPSNVFVDFPTQASPFTQDFCVTANGVNEDLEVIVVPLEQARPGFDTDYKVVIKNKGNVTSSGSVTLDFEEDFMTLLSTNPNAGNTPSNQLSWSFSNLQPFQMEEYEFTMTLNTPTATVNPLNGGDMLTFTGTVTGTGTDVMPADNVMVFDQTVVNSYDPNDKTCLEGETIDPADVGEYVHYMIRFENTGTASAVNIVVKDEIDLTQFDISTLIPLGGSHDYYTRIREGNVVEFIHED